MFMSNDLKEYLQDFGIEITGSETMDQLEDLWYRGAVSFHDIHCLEDDDGNLIYGIVVKNPNGENRLITDESATDLANGLTSIGFDVTDVCFDYNILPENNTYDYCISENKYEKKTGSWINRHNHFTHQKRTQTLKSITLKDRLALAPELEKLAQARHDMKLRNTNKKLN
jgi:hypothetical protein